MTKAFLCLTLAVASLSAQELKQGDRDRMLSYLHSSQKQLLDAIEGLSHAQWKFKSAPDRWSVGEVVEHLVLAEKGLFEGVKKTADSPAGKAPATKVPDENILKGVPDRSQKFKAPDPFVPKGIYSTAPAGAAAFQEARGVTLDWARTTKIDLRNHFQPSPLGELDSVQWILFMSAHNERHVAQILEVKADPKFPKK